MNYIKRTHIGRAVLIVVATLVSAPAFAQVDLAGMWGALAHQDWMERVPGPDPVDYLGLPLNDEGRNRALMYDYSILAQPEHQCGYYTQLYLVIGPVNLKIWSETDQVTGQVIAWKLSGYIDLDIGTIWMDGRPHPSRNAFHPYGGFTTGKWEGNTLTTYTTHMKAGYLRRNGVPTSDRATLTKHILRHDDLLTITAILEDPVYLTEPYVVSKSWLYDPRMTIRRANYLPFGTACEPIAESPRMADTSIVPHFLPGKNPFIGELSKMYNLPIEAVLGGAETMYPEYRKKLKDKYVRPEKCVRYCGEGVGLGLITDGSGQPQR